MFLSWGYNRAAYTRSDIQFAGPRYDFTLEKASASDRPDKFGLVYFKPNTLTIPQYNLRLGYYIANHWSLSFGTDHYKYVLDDKNEVLVNGYIEPGLDPTGEWSGTYDNTLVVTDRNTFHYENTDGCNYLRTEFARTDQWFYLGQKQQFIFSTMFGLGVGPIVSVNDLTFAGTKTMRTYSFSGFGTSGSAAMRFEFFKRIFLQTRVGGGYINQTRVKTRPGSNVNYAKQQFGFITYDISFGVLFYLPVKNGCNTCPHW